MRSWNAFVESFNGRMREELLNLEVFDSLMEAAVLIEDWRVEYNTYRPHPSYSDAHPGGVRRPLEARE